MQQLACRRCGASLKVPEALTAVVVTCQFCGESTPLPNDLLAVRQAQHRAVTMQAGDHVMPDIMWIGGVSGWLRSVPIAAAAGIEVSMHLHPEASAHLRRVTETAHWLQWQDWADPILKEPFPVVAGQLQIPDRAGIGIEWDEHAVKRFAA